MFFIFILFSSISAFTQPQNQLTDAEYHAMAAQAAENKSWQDAVNYEKKAYNLNHAEPVYAKQLCVYYNNYAIALLGNSRYDLAMGNFKEALKFDPANNTVKDNMYNVTMDEAGRSLKALRVQEAVNLAKDCISYNPKRATAYAFLGNLYYQENKLEDAVKYWIEAVSLDPANAAISEKLDKAKRELAVERNFKTRSRAYFDIVFEGEKDPELIWDIMDILEDARRSIKSEFSFFAEDKITVVIYNTEQFSKTSPNALDWTLGLYDGKIRIKVGDILSNDKDFLRRIIYHEYGHAVLHILYPKNIPLWLHEGFARLSEPPQPLLPQEKSALDNLKKESNFNLSKISSMFESGNYNDMGLAYLESKAFLEYLIGRYGKYKFKALLEKLNSGMSFDEISYEIYRVHTKDLENDFVKNILY